MIHPSAWWTFDDFGKLTLQEKGTLGPIQILSPNPKERQWIGEKTMFCSGFHEPLVTWPWAGKSTLQCQHTALLTSDLWTQPFSTWFWCPPIIIIIIIIDFNCKSYYPPPWQTLTRKNAEIVEDLFRLSSSLPDFILDLLATLNFWISSQFRIFRPFCRILEEAATALSREN